MKAECVVCGKEFDKLSNNVKTCGAECRKENTRQYMQRFSARPDRVETERERGRLRLADRPPVLAVCMICGKEFRKIRSARTCSPECQELRRHPPGKPRQIIPPFPEDIDRDAFGHWLSGFADGEATFGLRLARTGRSLRAHPRAFFRIALRDDDSAVLRQIQSFWSCGRLNFSDNTRSKIANAKPVAIYGVQSMADMIGIVIPHFDRLPLRSKKARDYAIWRRGVELLARVMGRPMRYRPGHAPNRHGGTFPKWEDAEREEFRSLSVELARQRRYSKEPIRPLPI